MKFIMAKNVLAMAVTGALLCYSVGVMAEESFNVDGYEVTLYDNGAAVISKGNDVNLINTITGANTGRIVPNDSITRAILAAPENARHIVAQDLLTYPIYSDALKAENIRNIKAEDIKSIVDTKESLQKIIKPENKDDYIAAVNAGGTAEDFIKISNTTSGLSSLYKNVVEGQNFVLDSSGRITADGRADGNAQTVPVKEFVVELDNRTRNLGVEVKSQGDSLRGEIGGVYRDARAHTDSQVTAVRDELSRDIIAVTSAAVAQTDAAIASNTAAIRNNSHRLDLTEAWQKMATERMNNMQEQIKENRKELRESAAQSAALAGLFQPYSVGKFNATAAVGGYRDEQAIAVGVGYRFTENVAGKVAVAAGGSSASWNAGVNFEF
ncbi:YadA C-terminal domain-containing protein [Escherichia coli]|uniref:YadA C-terminal domain-containing protein n=1 Tax=Escherichia coli TaxID=562 RepID=UPI0020234231|nr:YadA C-terminal domain-containing protein [Escherichia coli]